MRQALTVEVIILILRGKKHHAKVSWEGANVKCRGNKSENFISFVNFMRRVQFHPYFWLKLWVVKKSFTQMPEE